MAATPPVGPMTDEAFAQLCAEHPDLNLERSAHGELIIMPPAYTWTGARNNEIGRQLSNLLPNGARRSPDAAWILKQPIRDLDPDTRTVEIYRPGLDAETRSGPTTLSGEGPVHGFALDLAPVWDPLSD